MFRPGRQSVPWPPQDDGLAPSAKRALATAQDEAARLGHNHVGPVHIFVGAIADSAVLRAFGLTATAARRALAAVMRSSADAISASEITVTPRAQRVIDVARAEARAHGSALATDEHLLVAALKEHEHFTSLELEALSVDAEALLDALERGGQFA